MYCMPWRIAREDQCAYVQDHVDLCGENTSLIPYMKLHYCWLGNQCAAELHPCVRLCWDVDDAVPLHDHTDLSLMPDPLLRLGPVTSQIKRVTQQERLRLSECDCYVTAAACRCSLTNTGRPLGR